MQVLIKLWDAFVFVSDGFKTVHPDFRLEPQAQKQS